MTERLIEVISPRYGGNGSELLLVQWVNSVWLESNVGVIEIFQSDNWRREVI